ncbi:MAG: hypothetical protein M3Y72_22760 [Acidobacteriota bacterium]|nr:hypothetical protein [Acidobacteriota bacterium]
MQVHNKFIAVLSLTMGLALTAATPAIASPNRWFQYGDRYGDIRGLVDRTQSDLRDAASLERNRGDARSRYQNTQRHLSTFDRHLLKGHFDKGELDSAISDLQHIIDKNTLQARSRDMLMRDIEDLRGMRSHR